MVIFYSFSYRWVNKLVRFDIKSGSSNSKIVMYTEQASFYLTYVKDGLALLSLIFVDF